MFFLPRFNFKSVPISIEPQLRLYIANYDFNVYDKLDTDTITRTITVNLPCQGENINEPICESRYKTYLMYDEISGAVKIGRAYDPQFREHTLAAQIPRIRLLAVCHKDIEKQLHEEYKAKRMRGEWFNLSQKDVNDIVKK